MLRVPALLLLGGHALGERPNKAAPLASSSSRQLPDAPASGALPDVSTSEKATELLKEIAAQSGRQWPSGLPQTFAEKHDEKKDPEKKALIHMGILLRADPDISGSDVEKKDHDHDLLKEAAKANDTAKAAQQEKVAASEPMQAREQDKVMEELLASAQNATKSAKLAKSLNTQEFSQRQQLEEATNESQRSNVTFEGALKDYQTAFNRLQTLSNQTLQTKQAMVEASQLAGTTQEELDSILQQWAASNATASETLGFLETSQRSFADANRTLVSAQLALEVAKKEEADAKKQTVDAAKRVLQAVQDPVQSV